MIDILSIEKMKGETKEDFIRRIIVYVDDNWLEIKSTKVGETPLDHYYRFQEYEKTPEFISFIIGERPDDTPATRTTRNMEVRSVQDLLKCAHTDHVFKSLSVRRLNEPLMEHYKRFIEIEESDVITDIVERRSNESKATFNMRLNLYSDTKSKILKLAEDELLNELTRIETDDKKETLKDWKERVNSHIKANVDFISKPRKLTTDNMREETHVETGKRVMFYQQKLMEIESLIKDEDVDKQTNDVYWKESQKLKAKKEAAEEIEKEQNENEKKKAEKILNEAKNNLFFGTVLSFSLIGFFMIVQHYGLVEASIIFTFIFGGLSLLYHFKKEWILKSFKISTIGVFWFFKILNIILNSIGMSVTNNRRF